MLGGMAGGEAIIDAEERADEDAKLKKEREAEEAKKKSRGGKKKEKKKKKRQSLLPDDNHPFYLRNRQSGRFLIAEQEAKDKDEIVKVTLSDDTKNALWYVIRGKGKFEWCWRLINKESSICVGLSDKKSFIGFDDLKTNDDPNRYWKVSDIDGSYCRFFNESTKQVIASNSDGGFDYLDASKCEKRPDQYWAFDDGDYSIVSVEFDLKHGKILDKTPLVIAHQTLNNESDHEQEFTFEFTKSVENTSSFEHSHGVAIKAGATGKCGLPLVAEGEVSTELSTEHTWTWGTEETTTQSYTASYPVKAGPKSNVQAQGVVMKATLNVPYTITVKSSLDGATFKSSGIWKGVSTWDLNYTVKNI
eukprot:629465_1